MESQEKINVPIFTGVNKDVFLQEIYPRVRQNFSAFTFSLEEQVITDSHSRSHYTVGNMCSSF